MYYLPFELDATLYDMGPLMSKFNFTLSRHFQVLFLSISTHNISNSKCFVDISNETIHELKLHFSKKNHIVECFMFDYRPHTTTINNRCTAMSIFNF